MSRRARRASCSAAAASGRAPRSRAAPSAARSGAAAADAGVARRPGRVRSGALEERLGLAEPRVRRRIDEPEVAHGRGPRAPSWRGRRRRSRGPPRRRTARRRRRHGAGSGVAVSGDVAAAAPLDEESVGDRSLGRQRALVAHRPSRLRPLRGDPGSRPRTAILSARPARSEERPPITAVASSWARPARSAASSASMLASQYHSAWMRSAAAARKGCATASPDRSRSSSPEPGGESHRDGAGPDGLGSGRGDRQGRRAELPCLAPATQVIRGRRGSRRQRAAVRPLQPDRPNGRQPVDRRTEGLLEATRVEQEARKVRSPEGAALRAPQELGHGEPVAKICDPFRRPPEHRPATTPDAQGEGQLRQGAGRPRDVDRLLGERQRFGPPALAEAQAAELAEHPGSRRRRRIGGHEPIGLFQRGLGPFVIARLPEVPAQALVDGRLAPWIGPRPEIGKRASRQVDGRGRIPGEHRDVRGALEQRDPVQVGRPGRDRDRLGELQRQLEVAPGLGERETALGFDPCRHRSRQGAIRAPGEQPVTGNLAGDDRRPGRLLERLGEGAVEMATFAGEQVAFGRLLEKAVAEGEPDGRAHAPDQEAPVGGLPECRCDVGGGEPGGDGHQLVVDLHADQRRDPQDAAGRLRDRRKSGAEQVVEHLRHVRPFAAPFGGEHLLGEERVPVAPAHHPVHEPGIRGRPEDPGDLGSQLGSREPGELDPIDQPRPLEVTDGRQHRVVGSKILGSDGQHQQEPAFPDPPDDEPEEGQRGLVGPLEVLDRDHRRPRLLQASCDPEEELEQAVPRDGPRLDAFVGTHSIDVGRQLGNDEPELGASGAQDRHEAVGLHLALEIADQVRERSIGRAVRGARESTGRRGRWPGPGPATRTPRAGASCRCRPRLRRRPRRAGRRLPERGRLREARARRPEQ